MKQALTSLVVSLSLLVPVVTACSADDAAGDSNTGDVDSEVKSGKKQTCGAVGGACIGLTPTSCPSNNWADASKVSCGGGVGVGCCLPSAVPPPPPPVPDCPLVSPPPPGFCSDGKIVPRFNENGCSAGLDCIPNDPPCPEIMAPPPGFCPDGNVVPRKSPKGCTIGFDCVPKAPNACEAAGGSCVGLAPSSCPGGTWGDAATYSCGGGIGVGCCLP